MVRTTLHTCKVCDKIYASYQSLCNHRTNKHKNDDNTSIILDNPLIILDNTSIIPTHFQIETVKTYNCIYCNRLFNNYQNRWKHHKLCKTKNHEIIQKNNTEIIQNQNNNSQMIENNGIINTNNGTINITNNIIINNYGQENLSYLKDELIKNTLIRLSKNDDDSLKNAVPKIAQFIHFNQFHKENNNLEINSIKSKTAKKMIDGKMKYVKKDDLLKDIHNKIVDFLQKYIDTHRLEITRSMMGGLKEYKLVSPSYIKKMIHEEINLLGYVYYKNYMDNESEMES
jgi:hypothetical protein